MGNWAFRSVHGVGIHELDWDAPLAAGNADFLEYLIEIGRNEDGLVADFMTTARIPADEIVAVVGELNLLSALDKQ